MAKRKPEWEALGFSSPEAYEDAKAASLQMLQIEYLMGVDDKLPEGYKLNEGPGKVLTALGLYGDQTDNPVFSRPANVRSYTRPIGGDGYRKLGQYVVPYKTYDTYTPDLEEAFGEELSKRSEGIQAAMLGGPTQEDDVFVDLTTQYNKVEGYPYEDTLKHELRHRGLLSERATRLNDVPEGAGVLSEEVAKKKKSKECRTPRTPYIRAYTPVASRRRKHRRVGVFGKTVPERPKRTGGEPFRRYDRRTTYAVRVLTGRTGIPR